MSLSEIEMIQRTENTSSKQKKPSKKNKDSHLESIIDSERYELKEFLGRGCWGIVYAGYDKILEEEVAIKILSPNQVGLEQMMYRNLDEFNAMRKEGGKLTACANIVPRRFEVDEQGKPFIVMPKYDKFFSDVLNDAFNSRNSRTVHSAFGEEKLFDSGLSMDEIIKYSRHVINGIAEIHKIYKKAHCDLKPDNLAVDDDGKVLVSDMGTSTYASFIITGAPRDNMGFLYTRSPRLFADGEHPKESSDIYSFGNLLYKMFTGEYVFEKEIDQAMKEGGLKKVKEFMKNFYERLWEYGSVTHSLNIQEAIDKKLKKADIPETFKRLISSCIHEHSPDGESLKRDFEESVTQYLEARVKKKAVSEFKKKLKKKLIAGIAGGTAFAGVGLGLAWLIYLGPRPNYANKTDMITRVQLREADKSEVSFEIDKQYINELTKSPKPADYENLLQYHLKKNKNKTLIDKITTEWIKTASEIGNKFPPDIISPVDYQARYHQLVPANGVGMIPNFYLNDYIKELLTYAIDANQIGQNRIDLEDALATTYLGFYEMHRAQKAANSHEFEDYIKAKDADGKYIIHEHRQAFLKRLIYNVSKVLPQNIRLKSG
ncbi:MAG TPA: protein kinase [Candidatus Nanoarchaeia archaeon]|nr:protein kinase [Candidatus Nanoarchaeia archaeon]